MVEFFQFKRYIGEIENNQTAAAGFEIIDKDEMLDEYIMLALRSGGLKISELQNRFGDKWFKSRQQYFSSLQKDNLVIQENDKIHLTKRGYALCDEILTNIL